MSEGRRFHPAELDIELGPESAELLATARDLEAYAATGLAAPTVGFEDRVMAAIADEPMPRRAGGFIATVRDAWAIAFGPGRPIALRAQAFAMLLALAVAVGSVGSVAVVGAARLLGDQGPIPPTVPTPSPTPSPTVVTPSPSPSITPSPTPSPTASPVETETAEPSGTDDHGGGSGNSGPGGGGSSDDSSGSSGSGRSSNSGTDDSSGNGSGRD